MEGLGRIDIGALAQHFRVVCHDQLRRKLYQLPIEVIHDFSIPDGAVNDWYLAILMFRRRKQFQR